MMGKRVAMCLGTAVLLFATAAVCFADGTAQIGKADKYVKAGNFSEAEEIYKAVISGQPGSDDALKAQRKLITMYIHQDKTTEAQADFEKMLSDYAANPNLSEQIYWVGRGYRVAEDFDKAASIYRLAIERAAYERMGEPVADKYQEYGSMGAYKGRSVRAGENGSWPNDAGFFERFVSAGSDVLDGEEVSAGESI